jgi:hypothetical protein
VVWLAAGDAPAGRKKALKALKALKGGYWEPMTRRNAAWKEWKVTGKRDWSFPESGKMFSSVDIDSI